MHTNEVTELYSFFGKKCQKFPSEPSARIGYMLARNSCLEMLCFMSYLQGQFYRVADASRHLPNDSKKDIIRILISDTMSLKII